MKQPRSRSARLAVLLQAVLFIALSTGSALLLASQTPAAPAINNVRIVRSGDLWTIVLEADGPMTAPKIGELDGPPRVYMDFEGVRTTVNAVAAERGAPVVRVRAALHSRSPLVTRVVVDLAFKQPIRTEAEQLGSGRFKILIGSVAPLPAAPSAPLEPAPPPNRIAIAPVELPAPVSPPPAASAPPPSPGAAPTGTAPPQPAGPPLSNPTETSPTSSAPGITPVPARSTTPPVPAKDAERYLEQIAGALEPYRKLRPTLMSIDRQEPAPPAGLSQARQELASVLRALTAFRPADTLKATHDLLMRSVSFALMAATLREDAGARADPEKMRNAASAAAGALLLLDRACTELACAPVPPAR